MVQVDRQGNEEGGIGPGGAGDSGERSPSPGNPMNLVVLDASILVAAADPTDVTHAASRDFLETLVRRGVLVRLPEFAVTEIACALARRLRDPVAARRVAIGGLAAVRAVEVPMDAGFLAQATLIGTRHFLRGADALYATAAEITGGCLISWDGELRSRAEAQSPTEWMAANTG